MTLGASHVLDLLAKNRARLAALGVRQIGLFGSVARGEHGPSSDLDFVVDFDRKSFDAYMDLKFFLEDLFDRRVDLVLVHSMKPRLKARILAETVYAPGLEGLP